MEGASYQFGTFCQLCDLFILHCIFTNAMCKGKHLPMCTKRVRQRCPVTPQGTPQKNLLGGSEAVGRRRPPAHSMPAFLSWIIPEHCTLCLWLSMQGKTMPRNLSDNSLPKCSQELNEGSFHKSSEELWTQSRRGCWEANYCTDNTLASYVQILKYLIIFCGYFPL